MTQNQAANHLSSPAKTWQDQLDQLVGLAEVKQQLTQLYHQLKEQIERQKAGSGLQDSPLTLHLALMGNPGTGKTTVARLIGDMYRDLGLLRRGHVIEVDPADLIEEHVGGTAQRTRELIQDAMDGVLFIDEAYQLSTIQFGEEVITTLLKALEDDRACLAVILIGYTEPMKEFFDVNVGLRRRIPAQNEIIFPDYSPDELCEIFQRFITEKGLIPSPEFNQTLQKIIAQMHKERDIKIFGNARAMRDLADEVEKLPTIRRLAKNLPVNTPVVNDDLPTTVSAYLTPTTQDINTVMAELNDLIGLTSIKQTVKDLVAILETQPVREALGQPVGKNPVNMVFSGNPGTGKTRVARLIGKAFKSLGVLRKGQLIEVRASDLFSSYVGQTAEKTEKVLQQALDGVLFIDEIYQLVPKNDQDTYRRDAIGVLMKFMIEFSDRLVIIAAGYPQDIQNFYASNPAFERKFTHIDFPDYSDDELLKILQLKVTVNKIELPAAAAQRALAYFKQERERAKRNGEPFINAGLVEKLLSIMKTNQHNRFRETKDPEIINNFIPDDIPGAPRIHEKQTDQSIQPAYQHYDLVSQLPLAKTTKLDDAMNACCSIAVSQGEEQGIATGFIVSEDGHVITAYHVIKGAETIQARLNGQKTFHTAEVVGLDENCDIAILRLPGDDQAYPCISLAPEGFPVDVMQEVNVLGFPLGIDFDDGITISKGLVSAFRQGGSILQVDASMSHGSGGGPVLDQENGYAVGIVLGGAEDIRSRLNFATNTQIIYQRFNNLQVKTTVNDNSQPASQEIDTPPVDLEVDGVMRELTAQLDSIKKTLTVLKTDLETRSARDMFAHPNEPLSLNFIFIGSPGSGKTQVARLMGIILKSVGVLRKGHLIKVTASELISEYVGQTAQKTADICKQALDGVLFIDEAHQLTLKHGQNGFHLEALTVLMEYMDAYPHRLSVIVTSGPKDIDALINVNPQLTKRFTRLNFPDHSTDEGLNTL